jgi:hypothetical protein
MTDTQTTIPPLHIEYLEDEGEGVESIELAKRTYIPGVVLRSRCPKCGAPWERDLSNDYLSYPETGRAERINAYCSAEPNGEECGEEWVAGYVRVEITVDPCDEHGNDVENGEPIEPAPTDEPASVLHVYEVNDGERYWIAAPTSEEALKIWTEEYADGHDEDDPPRVTLLTAEQAAAVTIDDDGVKKSAKQIVDEWLVAPPDGLGFIIGSSVY